MVGFIGSGNMAAALAIRHGIPAAQAATLVTETMAGTAALLTQTDTLAARAALSNAMDAVVNG